MEQDILIPRLQREPVASAMPTLDLSHIAKLTDDTGIIQHALYQMPNRKEGYCIDDNSRALLLMVWAKRLGARDISNRLLPVYLAFVHYMQQESGVFRNFMCYDRSCYEEIGSEDSFGRTLMALGYLVNDPQSSAVMVAPAKEMFQKAIPYCDKLRSLRGMANSIIGLCQFVQFNHPDDLNKQLVCRLADKLVYWFKKSSDGEWNWFEPILAYDNAMLPLSLLHAYKLTGNEQYREVAETSMKFLESVVFVDEVLRPVGNMGWYQKGGTPAQYDQQGIDAMAMVLYYQKAYQIRRNRTHLDKMWRS